MKKDLSFQAISLFSQDLGEIEPVMHTTSCMNPEDAELIGTLFALKKLSDDETKKEIDLLINFLEPIALGRWTGKGELTQLGLRLMHKNKQEHNLSTDIITEAEVEADDSS